VAVFALNPIAGFAGQDHINAPRATEESHRRARETWLQRKQPAQVAEYSDLEAGLRTAGRAQQELRDHVASLVDIESAEKYKESVEAAGAEVVTLRGTQSGDASA